VLDPELKKRIYKDGLISYLKDCQNAWELAADGQWSKVACQDLAQPYNAQQYLLEQKQLKI
jgi:polyphosphate kinase